MIKISPQPIIDKFGRATQETIANNVGVSRQTVSKWLNGAVGMEAVDLHVLAKFARACEVPPGEFLIMDCNGNSKEKETI